MAFPYIILVVGGPEPRLDGPFDVERRPPRSGPPREQTASIEKDPETASKPETAPSRGRGRTRRFARRRAERTGDTGTVDCTGGDSRPEATDS